MCGNRNQSEMLANVWKGNQPEMLADVQKEKLTRDAGQCAETRPTRLLADV
jgi:hypothetical protein